MLEKITINVEGVQVRRETLEGRSYLVAPVVILKEGVINGSKGPLYYPQRELSKTPASWDHKPIVVGHPMKDGEGVSACSPQVLEAKKVGMLLNTRWHDDKLKSEAWIEEEKAKKVEPRVIQALEKKTKMEASSGLFSDYEEVPGEYNGTKYDSTALNYRPDHLALLPDGVGALSVKMGGGLLTNEEVEKSLDGFRKILVMNGLLRIQDKEDIVLNGGQTISYRDVHSQLQTQLNGDGAGKDYSYVEDVYPDFFVYNSMSSNGGMGYYKDGYSVSKDLQVSMEGKPVPVRKHSEYRTMEGTTVAPRMMTLNQQKEDTVTTPTTPPPAPAAQPAAPAAPVFNSMSEFLQNGVPAQFKSQVEQGILLLNQQKEELIQAITTNASNSFTKEQLAGMDIQTLQNIARLATPAPAPAQQAQGATRPPPNYAGAATPPPVNNAAPGAVGGQQAHLVAPTLNFKN